MRGNIMNGKVKWSVSILSVICIILMISPACTAGLNSVTLRKKNIQTMEPSQSQYWALLFAVGIYEGNPDAERPEMLEACDNLYNVLLDSPGYWQTSNIHVVTRNQGLLQNLMKELLWLRKNSKSEDYVLVYLTTHGYYLTRNGAPWDLPPKEEPDGKDEFLFMYNGYSKRYGIVWDDLLNFFLSLIKCKGLCLIVDSCYSGGFNDMPLLRSSQQRFTAMSCQEDEVSYGITFSDILIAGFAGWADLFGNNDGINSAEEAFALAEFLLGYGEQHPTSVDLYNGEFPVTIS